MNRNTPVTGTYEGNRYWRRLEYQKFMVLTLDNGKTFSGPSKDVSVSGVFLCSPQAQLENVVGAAGDLNITIPEGEMEFRCQVVRANENGVAVSFQKDQNAFGMFVTHDLTLELLSKINNLFSQSLDLEHTFGAAVSHIKDFMHSKGASLFLLEDNGEIVCRACSGPVDIKGFVLAAGEGVVGRTIASGQPQIVYDTTSDPHFASKVDTATGFKTDSIICAPLKIQGHTFGALEVVNMRGHELFMGHDRVVLSTLASSTSMAIYNSRQAAELAEQVKTASLAKDANQAKSEFLSHMSHELRTPLNAIIGFTEAILGKAFGPVANEKQEEYIHDIHSSGHHLLQLINDILDVTVIEEGKLNLQDNEVVVVTLIEEVVKMMQPHANAGNVILSSKVGETVFTLRGDERRLRQILLNLISNAVKFTQGGGKVMLECHLENTGKLAFIVTDTGIGMSEEGIKTALEPFGQVDAKLNRTHEGTGLGLPLTVQLVESHGGTLEVESEFGVGTTITVLFPEERVIPSL